VTPKKTDATTAAPAINIRIVVECAIWFRIVISN